MKPRIVILASASLFASACMDHYAHVQETPVSSGIRSGPPIASSLRAYVLLRDTNPGLIAEARASLSCSASVLEISRQDEIIDIRANSVRWVAVVALFGSAALVALESKDSKTEQSLLPLLLVGGTAVVVAPKLAERQQQRFLGYVAKQGVAPAYRCEDHAVGDVRVTLRDENGTHERMTDERGRARFPEANAWSVRLAYIDDEPVPAVLVASDHDLERPNSPSR